MNVLVTGGAGFIGSNLVKFLVDHGHSVAVLDNLSSGYGCNLNPFPQVRFIKGDVRDETAVEQAIDGAEVVFHLAASVGNKRSWEHPIEDAEVNVLGTLRVLEVARRRGIRKMIYSSSAGIFGELKTLPIREDHPAEPDSPYGVSKLAGEKLCLTYSRLHGLESVCLRYFNAYGVNQRYDAYGNVIPIFAHQIFNKQPITIFGDGEQTRDFVNVRDVVQANYKAAMAEGISGAFNIASGTRITINRLAQLMNGSTQSPVAIQHESFRTGDVLHSVADIRAAKQAFGYEPTVTLEGGLQEFMEWFREDGTR